jgi:hypothetical protein
LIIKDLGYIKSWTNIIIVVGLYNLNICPTFFSCFSLVA